MIFKLETQGWRSWVGTYKPEVEWSHRAGAVTIAIPTEVITDPCHDRARRDPGSSLDDPAEALAGLPGLVAVQPPSDVTAFESKPELPLESAISRLGGRA